MGYLDGFRHAVVHIEIRSDIVTASLAAIVVSLEGVQSSDGPLGV